MSRHAGQQTSFRSLRRAPAYGAISSATVRAASRAPHLSGSAFQDLLHYSVTVAHIRTFLRSPIQRLLTSPPYQPLAHPRARLLAHPVIVSSRCAKSCHHPDFRWQRPPRRWLRFSKFKKNPTAPHAAPHFAPFIGPPNVNWPTQIPPPDTRLRLQANLFL